MSRAGMYAGWRNRVSHLSQNGLLLILIRFLCISTTACSLLFSTWQPDDIFADLYCSLYLKWPDAYLVWCDDKIFLKNPVFKHLNHIRRHQSMYHKCQYRFLFF